MKPLIVQKFGGATLATPEKIKAIAQRIKKESEEYSLVIVVSAMGSTTNTLIDLASQVSLRPPRREMDMLLSVGERTSMALLSMALHDIGIDAISFTGSQAGIITDDDHVNARIVDVRPFRVQESLNKGRVVILAGFQGVTEHTKEITTLGRGGTDVTAVAMAAALKATRCEILKEVPGVMTADPRIVSAAKRIPKLSYDMMSDMTFGGAKVVHHRAVELSKKMKIPLFVGAADTLDRTTGTLIEGSDAMYEKFEAISINSHEQILEIAVNGDGNQVENFMEYLKKHEIPTPQILKISADKNTTKLFVSGPQEVLKQIDRTTTHSAAFKKISSDLCSISITGGSSIDFTTLTLIQKKLFDSNIIAVESMINPHGLMLLLPLKEKKKTLALLHNLLLS